MARVFDRIVIAVPDLPEAIAQYERLLGVVPFFHVSDRGLPVAWVGLSNTVIELVQCPVERPLIRGIVFAGATMEARERAVANDLQIEIGLGDGQATADFRRQQPLAQSANVLVDHLVLRTNNADACIALFSHELGIRLALDKTAPEWGGRMLFFRAGKLTLEVIESAEEGAGGNYFWGIAYQCRNIADMARTVGERGVVLSDIRDGRKPGTRVATIKSHSLDIPTLLIQGAT